jgi:hypothetical protein
MHTKRLLLFSVLGVANALAARADDASHLAALKDNPTQSVDAATWFMGLPAEQKKAYAARLGQIVLESEKSPDEFVVAFGADKSPYPWVFVVGKKRLDLSEDNSFELVFRDDEWVEKQWGVHWSSRQNYHTETRDGRVFFKKGSARDYGSVWVPAAGWRYVGPKLIKSKGVLRAPKVQKNRN